MYYYWAIHLFIKNNNMYLSVLTIKKFLSLWNPDLFYSSWLISDRSWIRLKKHAWKEDMIASGTMHQYLLVDGYGCLSSFMVFYCRSASLFLNKRIWIQTYRTARKERDHFPQGFGLMYYLWIRKHACSFIYWFNSGRIFPYKKSKQGCSYIFESAFPYNNIIVNAGSKLILIYVFTLDTTKSFIM